MSFHGVLKALPIGHVFRATLAFVAVAATAQAERDFFSDDYFVARSRFRAAVEKAGGHLTALPLQAKGPLGEELTIDVAWFGSDQPRRALLHCSGLHGVEGFAGSAIQLQLLEEGIPPIPEDTAIVLVHALNPYGMAWLKRVNEHNVDLNRNFLGPDECYQGAPCLYRKLDGFLNPPSPPARGLFAVRAAWVFLRYGKAEVKKTVAGGQYEYERGLFYGGAQLEDGPTQYQAYIEEHLATVERLVVIDVHTGLGAFGVDTLLVDRSLAGTALFDDVRAAFGDRVEPLDSQGIAYETSGDHYTMFPRVLPAAQVYGMGQGFGTYGPIKVTHALREENRWHHYGDATVDHRTKRRLKEAFAPDDDDWRRSVLDLGRERLDQAMNLAFRPPS